MSWTYGFFNSIDADRPYNADQMSEIFDGLITQGVYESIGGKLAVQPNNGMTIQINTGRGWFGSRWVKNDSIYLLTLEDSDVILNRYAAICIRVDLSDSVRTAEPYIKYGDFASSPTRPAMERNELVKEYCLAYVYIKGGASAITAADIEDTRANAGLCGWVTGLIKQVDTATLWNQWQALFADFMASLAANGTAQQEEFDNFITSSGMEFDQLIESRNADFTTWFNSLQTVLDGDVAAALASNVVALQNRVKKITITIDGSRWSSNDDGLYTQEVAAPGVTVDNDIVVMPADSFKDAYVRMGCHAEAQAVDKITFASLNPENMNMTVQVIIIGI